MRGLIKQKKAQHQNAQASGSAESAKTLACASASEIQARVHPNRLDSSAELRPPNDDSA